MFKFNCNVRIVDMIMGSGKAQPLESLVLTENGFSQMRDIKIGTKVYGEDGLLHNVIGVFPQGMKETYRVVFSDNTSTLCCKEHLWTYQKPQDKAKGIFRTNTLEEILEMDLYKKTNRGDKNWQIHIPLTKPIQFEKNELPLPPYVLGVLLGDGCFRGSVSFTNTEYDVIDKVSNLLSKCNPDFYINQVSNTITYGLRDKIYNHLHCNRIKKYIEDLGLLNSTSETKFIPDIYKMSCVDDRLELLRGLIDTDGSVSRNSYEFSTASEQLCKDVVFIVQSLGGTATLGDRNTFYTYNGEKKQGKTNYRLYIRMPNNLTACSSFKHLSKIEKGNTSPCRTIREIISEGKTECQCILVDNSTHLYLTNDFIVTHNTSSAINFINESDDNTKFLFITPYLDEVSRIKESCPFKNFKEPKQIGTKLEGIKYLISRGENIVSTHALFQRFDNELIDMCRAKNYTLIMDEVTDVIEKYQISKEDFKILTERFVDIDEKTGMLTWRNTEDEYIGKFQEEKRLCELNSLAYYGGSIMMWLFPIEVFNSFRNVYILTYMFDSQLQRYYYDYYDLPYKYIYVSGDSVENYHFTEIETEKQNIGYDFKNLIHILEDEKLNMVGDREYDLSKSWYLRNKGNAATNQLKNNIENFFRNKRKTKTSENLWTTFKDFKSDITGKGYGRGFVPLNMRASNQYRERTSVAYPVNRYINTGVKNFFIQHDVEVDEDGFAVSEMLQFIWRSAIRDGKEIWVYIPSIRMRSLLKEWIENNTVEEDIQLWQE